MLPTVQPTVPMGSVCITVSIATAITQGEWVTPDAITATKEALAISMGVPIDSIHVNYADKLCQASLILSPDQKPIKNRRTLTRESILIPSIVAFQQNSSIASVYDTKMSLVHVAADTKTQLQVQFSVDIRLLG
jgi:hypothetical protein